MIGTLQQAFNDMVHGTYNLTNDGKCTGCGQCCSNYLPLSEGEVKDIRRYIRKHNIKEQKHSVPLAKPVLDLTCPFLNDVKSKDKCAIYPVRPAICRIFNCSQSANEMASNKALFHHARRPCNMRKTFLKE